MTGDTSVYPIDFSDTLHDMFVGGDVLGDIYSYFIEHLEVVGDIGPSVPCYIEACGYIRNLEANSINGTLNLIPEIGCFGILGTVTLGGDFTGQINCNQVGGGDPNEGLFIGGDVDADLWLYNAYDDSVSLRIGGSFDGLIYYDDVYPFEQVIINADNGSGEWNGDVWAGDYTIGPGENQPDEAPYYERLSSAIGDSAIGLAPFHLHDDDCDPPNETTQMLGAITNIVLRHYGPVQWDSGDPVVVYWRLSGSTDPWSLLNPNDWSATAGATPRDIVVTAENNFDFDALIDYKIVPSSNLKCADVTGNPAVDQWVYYLYGQ